MSKQINNNVKNEGFTIIEVLIVLAIAALILLVVFLAIPALQRSQRNNGRQAEASRLSSVVTAFVSDNNGELPGFVSGTYNSGNAIDAGSTILNTWGIGATPATVKYLAPINATAKSTGITSGYLSVNKGTLSYGPGVNYNAVVIDDGVICGAIGTTMTLTAGSANNVAVVYPKETPSGDWNLVCIQAQ
ncbi:MAG: prepilin-type N-terminal cleavage/methylation domain-containing protein [bacterium]